MNRLATFYSIDLEYRKIPKARNSVFLLDTIEKDTVA